MEFFLFDTDISNYRLPQTHLLYLTLIQATMFFLFDTICFFSLSTDLSRHRVPYIVFEERMMPFFSLHGDVSRYRVLLFVSFLLSADVRQYRVPM